MSRRLLVSIVALALLSAACAPSTPAENEGAVSDDEQSEDVSEREYQSVAQWVGSGYEMDWPADFEFLEPDPGDRTGVDEVFLFVSGGSDFSGRGLLVVGEAASPYEEGQIYLRRELQPLLDEFNYTAQTDIEATTQGTLSVAPGSSQPGLFVNVVGERNYGAAAVVPLDDGRVLKVVVTAIMRGGTEDPEVKQLLAETVASIRAT